MSRIIKIKHTDLKPENILLVNSHKEKVKIQRGRNSSQTSESHTTRSKSRSRSFENKHREHKKIKKIKTIIPSSDRIKLIDFGGATFEDEHHSLIINTR